MNYKVSISEQAEKDLNDIYSYIRYKLKSKAGADRIAQKLYGATASLSAMPKRFRLHSAEPWLSRRLRFVTVGNYSVFYLVNDDANDVLITRIAYGKRDMESVIK